jgi:multiple sugar transport system substrate-binding protein
MYKRILIGLVLASLFLASCAPAATVAPTAAAAQAVATTAPAQAASPAPAQAEATAAPTQAAPAVSSKPFQGVVLHMLDSAEGQTDAMIALQNKCMDETGVTMKVEVVSQDDVDTKMQTALAAKSPAYDIIGIDIIDLAKYSAAGWVEPLDSYIDQATKDDILPFALDGISYNGKILGLPWKAEYMVFVYNKKMLSDAGIANPPTTWDELVKDSQTLKEKNIVKYPVVFTWGAGYEQISSDYTMITKSLGGELFDKDGNPVFNQGAGVQALQLMNDMINKYKIVDPAALTIKGGGTRRDIMMAGNAAFGFLWGTPLVTMNDAKNSKLAGQFALTLAPNKLSLAGPMGESISAFSEHKDAAWAYLKCIAGAAGEKELFLKDGSPFGYKSVLADSDVKAKLAESGGDVAAQQAENLAVRPSLPYYAEFSSALQDTVQKVLTNQAQVQQGLDDLAKKSKDLQQQ